MTVRHPEWLDNRLCVRTRLTPVSLRLEERLAPLSSAVLTIVPGPEAPEPGDFIHLYTASGDAGIYRVQEIERHSSGLLTLRLQHGLCTLADHVLFGTRDYLGLDTGGDTGATITVGTVSAASACIRSAPSASGTVYGRVTAGEQVAVTGASRSWYAVTAGSVRGWISKACVRDTGEAVPTVEAILTDLLAAQSGGPVRWSAGTLAVTDHAGCSFTDRNLLSAVLSITDCAAGECVWQFDQTSLPWRLSLTQPGGCVCELRSGRNLLEYTAASSRSGLCTRLYPRGADGLTIADINGGLDYLQSPHAADEGIVSRIYLAPQEQNAAALLAGAQRQLNALDSTRFTVTCEAVDLSAQTGEDRDRIQPGRRCLLAVPGLGCPELTVTAVLHRDAYREPGRVTVTLASTQATITSLVNGTRSGLTRIV